MAIVIINENPDRNVVKRTICHNCGCTLEYTPSDTIEEKVTDYTGGGGHP